MKTIAILTSDERVRRRLDDDIQPDGCDIDVQVIRDEPDMSFRSLRAADIVICGQDVPESRISRLQRALGRTGSAGSLVRVVPHDATRHSVLTSLTLGVRAILREDELDAELPSALREIDRDRYYLSASLIPFVLEHFRELCETLRKIHGLDQDDVVAFHRCGRPDSVS